MVVNHSSTNYFLKGDNMECECYTHNCCPAVDGREKICPQCKHIEWVVEYKLFIARDASKEVKAMYNKHGLKAFSVIKEDAETSLDNW